jgi:hypothetical protein
MIWYSKNRRANNLYLGRATSPHATSQQQPPQAVRRTYRAPPPPHAPHGDEETSRFNLPLTGRRALRASPNQRRCGLHATSRLPRNEFARSSVVPPLWPQQPLKLTREPGAAVPALVTTSHAVQSSAAGRISRRARRGGPLSTLTREWMRALRRHHPRGLCPATLFGDSNEWWRRRGGLAADLG